MKHFFNSLFRRVPADDVRREQLFEAERLHVEHLAAGEMHCSLAAVYKLRADRLRRELASAPVAQLRPVHSQET